MAPDAEVDPTLYPGRDIVPRLDSLADYVAHWARRTPDAPFDHDGDRRRTYAAALADMQACAGALLACGVTPVDVVVALVTPGSEFITLFGACSLVGATWVGLNPAYSGAEIRHVVTDARPALVVTLGTYRGRDVAAEMREITDDIAQCRTVVTLDGPAEQAGQMLSWADFLAAGAARVSAAPARVDRDDAAMIVYTSGTTGRPKGAEISHRAFAAGCYYQASRFFHESCRVIANLPVNHVAGLLDMAGVPIAAGGCLHFMAEFDPDALLAMIEQERITMWGGVPTILQTAMSRPAWGSTDFGSLRYIVWGGAPMPIGLVPPLRATGAQLTTVYGLTESCVSFAYNDPGATDEQLAATIGRPDPRLQWRIGDQPQETPAGVPGELELRNACLMTGYRGLGEATAAVFTADGYLRTGDVAVLRDDGTIQLIGRTKEMFKSGGYNVYPREVEAAIETHPAIREVVVVDVPDPLYHQVGAAFLVVEDGVTTSAELIDSIREHAAERLAKYKIPKTFQVLDALPRSGIGKVDKTELRARAR